MRLAFPHTRPPAAPTLPCSLSWESLLRSALQCCHWALPACVLSLQLQEKQLWPCPPLSAVSLMSTAFQQHLGPATHRHQPECPCLVPQPHMPVSMDWPALFTIYFSLFSRPAHTVHVTGLNQPGQTHFLSPKSQATAVSSLILVLAKCFSANAKMVFSTYSLSKLLKIFIPILS